MTITTKRAYEPAAESDGFRILVDRLWPRGIPGDSAGVDLWMRGIAPSTGLRKWFAHRADRWLEFRRRYRDELDDHTDLLDLIRDIERRHGKVTLLFGAKDEERNNAAVVAERLEGTAARRG